MLQEIYLESLVAEVKINVNKSKVNSSRQAESVALSLDNEIIKQVGDYIRVGEVVSADSNPEKEIWACY